MRLLDRLLDPLICPACIRFRFSPIHLWNRWVTRIDDGRNGV